MGTDAAATRWLKGLDERLGCPPGVVSATTSDELRDSGLSIAQWVSKIVTVQNAIKGMNAMGAKAAGGE